MNDDFKYVYELWKVVEKIGDGLSLDKAMDEKIFEGKEYELHLLLDKKYITVIDTNYVQTELGKKYCEFCKTWAEGLVNEKVEQLKEGLKKEELPVITEKELSERKANPIKWYAENTIPENAIIMWAGKRASYKSWVAIHLAVSLATGSLFLNKFQTTKINVLYIDEENGEDTLKDRMQKIKNGMIIKGNIENLYFLSFHGFKIENDEYRIKLENFLINHNPCVVIVDSLRRIISCEENDATEINKIFTELFRPISQKYNTIWILIHHMRKGIGSRKPDDIMDELRGSSELTNYADVVNVQERPHRLDNRFIFRQLKCRRYKELPPYMIELKFDDITNSLIFETIGTAEEILDSVDLCMKQIMIWFEENNIGNFETHDATNIMKKHGYSSKTSQRAISVLLQQGKIVRETRGHYRVVRETLNNYSEGTEGQRGQDHK